MGVNGISEIGLSAPQPVLDVGVTGHRSRHPVFSANSEAIAATLADLLGSIERIVSETGPSSAPARLHWLLAYGADMMAVGPMLHGAGSARRARPQGQDSDPGR